ncbi:hypothetical protein DZ860_19615 [Vibrio sinensis]|uniref:Uncharacterized protein n=1 Tax=Vibrio sinensis TaxID=2302434 RepID=A0A3A6Q7A4_9VIBR|nr:hypothetical protein DZ860_19615 [Vibrio sinensis]
MVVSLLLELGVDDTSEEKIFNNHLANETNCFNLINKLVTNGLCDSILSDLKGLTICSNSV